MHFDVNKRIVYSAIHGSHAYGTNGPDSDIDIKGFCVSPKSFVQGFAYNFEQHQTIEEKEIEFKGVKVKGPVDSAIYDIRKFCNLAADCNPNIIEVLFVDESDIISIHPAGRLIRDNRELFISKKARHTFSGYAISQLKRIRTHRNYLLNPPDRKPTREEFGLAAQQKITPDMMGAFDKIQNEGTEINPNVMELVQKEKQYKAALDAWNSYNNWKEKRNPKRAAMEAESGYDRKHAMHLVRLLTMCREILEGKGVIVKRPDKDFLLEIKRGAWTYEQLVSWAEKQDAEMQELYLTSKLPHAPNIEKLNSLCVEAQEMFWTEERLDSYRTRRRLTGECIFCGYSPCLCDQQ